MKKNIYATHLLFLIVVGHTYAATIPRSIKADEHVKVVAYDPNNVVLLKSRYGYQTQITFANNETVKSVSIGDSLAWLAVPVSNNLFIKPIAESTTNMTVLTNRNSYNFQLDSTNNYIKPTYKLSLTYPENALDNSDTANINSFDLQKINWKYSFTGDKAIAPLQAFDDGQFTYFKFKTSGASRLPSVFIVDKNRHEALVNFHMQGDYLVVNAVGKQFTLRDGDYVTCVYNNSAIGGWQRI